MGQPVSRRPSLVSDLRSSPKPGTPSKVSPRSTRRLKPKNPGERTSTSPTPPGVEGRGTPPPTAHPSTVDSARTPTGPGPGSLVLRVPHLPVALVVPRTSFRRTARPSSCHRLQPGLRPTYAVVHPLHQDEHLRHVVHAVPREPLLPVQEGRHPEHRVPVSSDADHQQHSTPGPLCGRLSDGPRTATRASKR